MLRPHADVRMTRETDVFIPLGGRIAPANASCFVSIHCNGHSTTIANGTETLHFALGHVQSKGLADSIQTRLIASLGRRDRGLKLRSVQVLRQVTVPAALAEIAFISNPAEETLLRSVDAQERAARAIADGIMSFLGVRLRSENVQPAQETSQTQALTEQTHTVAAGDTLWGIARRYGVTAVQLRMWNNMQTDVLRVGQQLIVTSPAVLPSLERRGNCDIITAKPNQLRVSMIRGQLNQDGINGGFLDGNLNPLGVVVIDGKIITDRVAHRPPRPVFVVESGRADIHNLVESASALDRTTVTFALGAGPLLLPQVSVAGGFQADIMTGARPRSAVGITADGLVKLVATDALTLGALSELIRALGCVKAMNLDGGGSVAMRFGGELIRGGERSISTAITLVR